MRIVSLTLFFLLAVAGASIAWAAPPTPEADRFAGDWNGVLTAGSTQLRLIVHLKHEPGGRWRGSMDSVDQAAPNIPIDSVTVAGNSLTLLLNSVRGSYQGTLSDDGKTIRGTWSQSGVALPLDLARLEGPPPVLVRPQEPKPPLPYHEENVTYENADAHVKLAGTLTKPSSGGPFPVVLLITGSGPQDRNETVMGHKPFLVLSDYLTRHGIAVLRVDDRGVGESTGEFAKATSEDFASDALAGVAFLKQRPDIDPKHIGLIGHSEGGVIAPMVAARSKDVAFIVLMAGVGVNMEDLLREQSRLILKVAGMEDSFIEMNDHLIAGACAIVRAEPDAGAAKAKLRDLAGEALAGMTETQRAATGTTVESLDAGVGMINSPWFRYLLTYDPLATLRRVKVPVLALNGSLDLQVPPKQNLPPIAKVLKETGNPHSEADELPGLNHLFQTAETGSPAEYTRIEETMAPAALEKITTWILARTTGSKG